MTKLHVRYCDCASTFDVNSAQTSYIAPLKLLALNNFHQMKWCFYSTLNKFYTWLACL